MVTIILDRSEVSSDIHDNLWENMMDDLGLTPTGNGEYPERVVLHVAQVEVEE